MVPRFDLLETDEEFTADKHSIVRCAFEEEIDMTGVTIRLLGLVGRLEADVKSQLIPCEVESCLVGFEKGVRRVSSSHLECMDGNTEAKESSCSIVCVSQHTECCHMEALLPQSPSCA